MRRRRLLVLAGTVPLAGCSGGEPTETEEPGSATDTPTEGSDGESPTATPEPTEEPTPPPEETPTRAAVDTERAKEALSAAHAHLDDAVSVFDATSVPLSEIADAFAYDRELVTGATAAAEARAATAVEVGDDGQVAAGRAYLSLSGSLRALADAHTSLIEAAGGVERAASEAVEENYEIAVETLTEAKSTAEAAAESLERAERELAAFGAGVADAALSDPVAADIAASLTVHLLLTVLIDGRRASVQGVSALETGIDAFRNDEYANSSGDFAEAFGHFEDAIAARRGYDGDLMAETVEAERCLAREHRDVASTFQSAALEVVAGNRGEGFDDYRAALSKYRSADRRC